jgi:beta-glucosidase-like glycosyl hydrolase
MAYNKLNGSQAQSPEHMNITRTAALQAMTLLKNDKAVLPLKAASFTRFAQLRENDVALFVNSPGSSPMPSPHPSAC